MFPLFVSFYTLGLPLNPFSVTPFCVQDQRTEYTVGLNEQTVITCEVQSDPSEASFKWFYNNSSETTELKNFLTSGSRSVLKYTPTSRYSYGTLFCVAQNSLGIQSKPCVFNVMPAGEYGFFIFSFSSKLHFDPFDISVHLQFCSFHFSLVLFSTQFLFTFKWKSR